MGNGGNVGSTRSTNWSFFTDQAALYRGRTTQAKPFTFSNPAYRDGGYVWNTANWSYPQPWSASAPSFQYLYVWSNNSNNECGVYYRSTDANFSNQPTVDLTGSKTRGSKVRMQYEFTDGTASAWYDLSLVRGPADQERKWWSAVIQLPLGELNKKVGKFNFFVEYYV
ncbi:Hypothetical protein ORPV_830 [Orpheovirus IHUMI-LCC2]|uniref:Uncharacterized protein n=1 Tax=Orpheovirus IHUMI-LCC2 TaxID=2023057 RepID=A0A2I2L5C7_9VIRU|nr:Hypothetical protein ORPV_830 [Orpheovirus IHUMI-LCC2]SNW62734.1 Hypothetical protein ORPV_830 [Orpheovirus IHUMI-LCC2]